MTNAMNLSVHSSPMAWQYHHHIDHHHDNYLSGEPVVQQDHGSDQQKLWTATESLQSPSQCLCKSHICAIKSSCCGFKIDLIDHIDAPNYWQSQMIAITSVALVNANKECFVSDGDPRMTFVRQNHTSKRPPLQKESNLNVIVCLWENVAVMLNTQIYQ